MKYGYIYFNRNTVFNRKLVQHNNVQLDFTGRVCLQALNIYSRTSGGLIRHTRFFNRDMRHLQREGSVPIRIFFMYFMTPK